MIKKILSNKNFPVLIIFLGLGILLIATALFLWPRGEVKTPSSESDLSGGKTQTSSGAWGDSESGESSDLSVDSDPPSKSGSGQDSGGKGQGGLSEEKKPTGSGSVDSSPGSGQGSSSVNDGRFVWPKPQGRARAYVKTEKGLATLSINGKTVPPLMFFGNTDMTTRYDVLLSEFQKAAKGNIHLHSVITNPEIGVDNPPEVQYFNLQNHLDLVLEGDPEGFILLRVNVGKYFGTSSYPQDEIVNYVNPKNAYNPMVSIASDLWLNEAKLMLADLVDYIRQDPLYSQHVIGYHLECGEWFQYMFRENGLDISPANSRKFRAWLQKKYKTDSALRSAWADSSVSLNTVLVPSDLPGNLSGKPEDMTLMLKDTDQRYIDYMDYIGDLVAGIIEELAEVIKVKSQGENIVTAFYGYLFELADPQSGHFSLEKLLASPHLDGFASPETYLDRNKGELLPKMPAGATGAYMTTVDSIQRAGKLWFVESDQRTFINRYGASTEHDAYLVPMTSINEILEVSKRNVGVNMTKGAAIWFMDLWSVGWLDDQAIWDNNGKLADVYHAYSSARKNAPKIDVALVVDEKAMSLVAQPTDSAWHFLSYQRFDFYRAGLNFGMFTKKDLLEGNLGGADVIFMLTPFRLSSAEASRIKTAIKGKTIVFSYGFGHTDLADVKSLTGMDFALQTGSQKLPLSMYPLAGSAMLQLNQKNRMRAKVSANPRYHVVSGYDEAVGKYSDGKIAFALKDNGSHKAVFFGGMRMDTDVIRALVSYSGKGHVFMDSDDVVVANEDLLVFHSSKKGVKTLQLPVKTDVYDYFTGTWHESVKSIKFSAEYGETRYFFYGKRKDIEAMKLPVWK